MKWIERPDGNHYSSPYRIYRGVRGFNVFIYADKSACLAQQVASLEYAKQLCADHQAKQKGKGT
jgi:hypothetical protein